jgi:hypothetical protein
MKPAMLAALMFLCPLPCAAQVLQPQQLHQQEIQRAIIQLDQRSADFARGTVPPLDPFVGRPLHPDPEIAQQLRPYERLKAAEANQPPVLRLPPPEVRKVDKPLPLPGGPPGALEPNPITSPRVAD